MDKKEKTRIIALKGIGIPIMFETYTDELEQTFQFLQARGYLFEVINNDFFETFSKDGKLCLEPTKFYDE